MNKEVKVLIKQLKRHYTLKYQQALNYLQNSEDTQEEKESNIKLLIANEKYYAEEIEEIKLNLELKAKEEEYREKVDSEDIAQEKMLSYVKEQIMLIREEVTRVKMTEETSVKAIENKQRKIEKLNARLENLDKCKQKLEELVKELKGEKRKVGRPKKVKAME